MTTRANASLFIFIRLPSISSSYNRGILNLLLNAFFMPWCLIYLRIILKKPMAWKSRKTGREKLERKQEPKVVKVPPKMRKGWGTGTMVIATPLLVDSLVRKVKKGKLVTVTQIMERLARDFHTDCACPMTTGIFLRIAAEAAEEDIRAGKRQVTPYWRVLKVGGKLNEKFPGGVKLQARRLRAEGQVIVPSKGKGFLCVRDFEKCLQKL